MNAGLREEKIKEWITNHKPISKKVMVYNSRKATPENVYEIPVDYLIFNQYNGRIGTFVKTYEKQNEPIDASTKEGENVILDFLWASNVKRNKETQKDISEKGQMEFGIVTRDGVVIDGNRRCMLLKKIAAEEKITPTYFRAVVLDDTLESNPKEIRKLETIYQMGVDEKVDYSPIEQYLKCKDLSDDFTNEEIAKMMGKKPSDIKNYLETLNLMEDYLLKQGYQDMYTVLGKEKVEGPFVDLRGYLEKQQSGKGIQGRDWLPEKEDIDDLKNVYFSYIRAGFRTAHGIRDIGNSAKGQGFFNHTKVWNEFLDRYDNEIDTINDNEKLLEEWRSERPEESIESIIKARDNDWKKLVESKMKANLGRTKRDLDDQNEENSPMELLQRAKRTLALVNSDAGTFDGQEIRDICTEIRKLAESYIKIVDKKVEVRMSIIIDTLTNSYILTGDIDLIKTKSRRKSNFESIGALFEEINIITVPFSTETNLNEYGDKEQQYKAILRLFDKFNIVYDKTEKAKNFLEDMDQENEKFRIFSVDAKNIRNNKHKSGDFKNFTNIIEKQLTRPLYKLQLLSAYHLAFSQNACNFSVPGAGKTATVYGAYAYLKSLQEDNPKKIDRLLIISPLAAFAPWKNEYKECFGRETSVKELVGVSPEDRKNHFYSDIYTEITLISYQSASSMLDIKNIKAYLNRYNVMVVLDEAHKIKNVEGGKQAEAILSIAKYANSRVVLTGTPAPNGYQDLYNLYQFIYPDHNVIGYPVHYLQELSNTFTPKAKEDIAYLIENISPFFIRVKKSDLGLPDPLEHEPIMVDMSVNQRKIYSYIEKKYVDYFEKEDSTDTFVSKLKKAKLIRLMQCVTNPNLLNKALDNYLDEEGLSNGLSIDDRNIMQIINLYNLKAEIPPKFLKIKEILDKIFINNGANGKVIIWTIFVQNILDLKDYLNSEGIECELLYGATPNENDDTPDDVITREKIIHNFHQEKCSYKVIIANPFAVGESISLHKACHNAIYLEKNFNAAMYMQSKDRVHRYGLGKNDIVNYYYLLSKDSIDETIHRRVLEKEERMLNIIESEEIPLLNMNMEDVDNNEDRYDIQAIIRDYHDRTSSKI